MSALDCGGGCDGGRWVMCRGVVLVVCGRDVRCGGVGCVELAKVVWLAVWTWTPSAGVSGGCWCCCGCCGRLTGVVVEDDTVKVVVVLVV
eukprot:3995693-Amphidinium_carterae.2